MLEMIFELCLCSDVPEWLLCPAHTAVQHYKASVTRLHLDEINEVLQHWRLLLSLDMMDLQASLLRIQQQSTSNAAIYACHWCQHAWHALKPLTQPKSGAMQLLNAKPENVERESEIVAQSGRRSAVTIATNMAGRGTDIILGGNAEFMARLKLREMLFPSLVSLKEGSTDGPFQQMAAARKWQVHADLFPVELSKVLLRLPKIALQFGG